MGSKLSFPIHWFLLKFGELQTQTCCPTDRFSYEQGNRSQIQFQKFGKTETINSLFMSIELWSYVLFSKKCTWTFERFWRKLKAMKLTFFWINDFCYLIIRYSIFHSCFKCQSFKFNSTAFLKILLWEKYIPDYQMEKTWMKVSTIPVKKIVHFSRVGDIFCKHIK